MRNLSILLMILFVLNSCQHKDRHEQTKAIHQTEYIQVSTPEYQLEKPKDKATAVLVLFGGYPEVAEDIKREFKILNPAKENGVAIIYSNYNQKLWFEEDELNELAQSIQGVFSDHNLPNGNIYIGGFSSGGDVALLVGDYLTINQNMDLDPKGIFIVDSPIDLAQLYLSSEKNIKRNFSKPSIQESTWLIQELGNRFGQPSENLAEYEKHSVFTIKTGDIHNIQNLRNTKIRLYTEPDSLWWKENRMADFDQTNAYLIKALSEKLRDSGFTKVEYLPTVNKGYRANGQRHPHSWAIVNIDELINWMLN